MNNHGTDGATEPIELPKTGDEITVERGLELRKYFKLETLVKRYA